MSERLDIILQVFDIPKWYGPHMSKEEEQKLFRLIQEASCPQEARLFRKLDCSAFCVEEKCYFCGDFEKVGHH
ncbi:MAG: hypothetical protein AB2693_15560 [Candidatus Thiodiazotropha sp.]